MGGMNNSHRRRAAAASDRVELDVGGSIFVASSTTLASSSAYFERLFSEEWHPAGGGRDGSIFADADDDASDEIGPDTAARVFVDQDPAPFAVLLSYMRLRHVALEDLMDPAVLLQADFLGMDGLLAAVKCLAYCNLRPSFDGTDEEAISKFDEEFGGVSGAVAAGILPRGLTVDGDAAARMAGDDPPGREFAHINILTFFDRPADLDSLIVSVEVPSCPGDEINHASSAARDRARCGTTFLDALNFLHRRGFVVRESNMQQRYIIAGSIDDRLTFSRCTKVVRPRSSITDIIVRKTPVEEDTCGPKEFAFIVESQSPRSESESICVYADLGGTPVMHETQGEILHVCVRNTKMTFDDSFAAGMDWLHKQGYTQEETALGDIFQKAWNKQYWDPVNRGRRSRGLPEQGRQEEGPYLVKLWSRRYKKVEV